MIRAIIILIVFLISCRQSSTEAKTENKDIKLPAYQDYDEFIESKKYLDTLFIQNRDLTQYSYKDMRITLLIGQLFDKKVKHAVLRFKDNDTVANVIVLRQSEIGWDTAFSTKVYPVSTSVLEELIEVNDFNGDDISDLKVVKEFWDMRPGEHSDLWLYRQGHFIKVQGFDSIISAAYDRKTDLIYSYQSTGCADMSMYFGVFRIVDDKVQQVKEMYLDCCVNSSDSCMVEVIGQKPYMVPCMSSYKHVPDYYAEGVKQKCEMVDGP